MTGISKENTHKLGEVDNKSVWNIQRIMNSNMQPYWKYISEEYKDFQKHLIKSYPSVLIKKGDNGLKFDVKANLFGEDINISVTVYTNAAANKSLRFLGEKTFEQLFNAIKNKLISIQTDELLSTHLEGKLKEIDKAIASAGNVISRGNGMSERYVLYLYKTDGSDSKKISVSTSAISDRENKFITAYLSEKYPSKFFGEVSKHDFIKQTKQLYPAVSNALGKPFASLTSDELASRYVEKYKEYIGKSNTSFQISPNKEDPNLGNLYFKATIPDNNIKGHTNYRVVKREVILEHEPIERLQNIVKSINKYLSLGEAIKFNEFAKDPSSSPKKALPNAVNHIASFIEANKTILEYIHFGIISDKHCRLVAFDSRNGDFGKVYGHYKPFYGYKNEPDTRSPFYNIHNLYMPNKQVNYHGIFDSKDKFIKHVQALDKPNPDVTTSSGAQKIIDNHSQEKAH